MPPPPSLIIVIPSSDHPSDDLRSHNILKHPVVMYKCLVPNCLRWFSSRKSRDKHSDNTKSRLHSSTSVKAPPPNAIFIENASQDQMDIIRNYSTDCEFCYLGYGNGL